MRILCTLILLSVSFYSHSQNGRLQQLVNNKKANHIPFAKINPFRFVASKKLDKLGSFQQLRLNTSFNKQVMEERPEALQLTVPLSSTKSITCELVQFSPGFVKYTENNDKIIDNVRIPVTYRGVIANDTSNNTVTLTVNDEYLSLVAVSGSKVIQLTKADEKEAGMYRIYDNSKILFPAITPLDCGTKESTGTALRENGIDLTGGSSPTAVEDKCVYVFVDCFDSLYFNFGSSKQRAINYVYELFTSVITGYYKEKINIQIVGLNVWTTPDPFRGDTRQNALADLAAYYKDNFFGNICVGLDFSTVVGQGRSGLAGEIGKVKAVSANTCPAYSAGSHPFCYNDMNYSVSVSNFPVGPNTTGQQVYLVMHEMGHLLGANHTKWCGWKLTSNPDTFGALDSCGTTEGGCPKGAPPPSGGATIMSYCVGGSTPNDFVNYNNGFGTQPGNAIRSFVDGSSCISRCSECFGLLQLNKLNKTNSNEYALKEKAAGNSKGNKGESVKQPPVQFIINPKKQRQ